MCISSGRPLPFSRNFMVGAPFPGSGDSPVDDAAEKDRSGRKALRSPGCQIQLDRAVVADGSICLCRLHRFADPAYPVSVDDSVAHHNVERPTARRLFSDNCEQVAKLSAVGAVMRGASFGISSVVAVSVLCLLAVVCFISVSADCFSVSIRLRSCSRWMRSS